MNIDPPEEFYTFQSEVWLYPGAAAWHFITLPKRESDQIKEAYHDLKRGWGSLPVIVTIGNSTWETSIFPDKKAGAYLLPLKSQIRKKEKIGEGDKIKVQLKIQI